MARRSQSALSRAYYSAQRAKRADRIAEQTANAPQIRKVLKSGKLAKVPLENGTSSVTTWKTVAEAEKVARHMESMNPGSEWRVVNADGSPASSDGSGNAAAGDRDAALRAYDEAVGNEAVLGLKLSSAQERRTLGMKGGKEQHAEASREYKEAERKLSAAHKAGVAAFGGDKRAFESAAKEYKHGANAARRGDYSKLAAPMASASAPARRSTGSGRRNPNAGMRQGGAGTPSVTIKKR